MSDVKHIIDTDRDGRETPGTFTRDTLEALKFHKDFLKIAEALREREFSHCGVGAALGGFSDETVTVRAARRQDFSNALSGATGNPTEPRWPSH